MYVILANAGALITLFLGLIAIVRPTMIQKFVPIRPVGKLGQSEIRATYGGFFAGMASYALYSAKPEAFAVIGVGWLMAAAVRLVSIVFGNYTVKNLAAVAFEGVIGLLCCAILLSQTI